LLPYTWKNGRAFAGSGVLEKIWTCGKHQQQQQQRQRFTLW
jgi:hypothetical protein